MKTTQVIAFINNKAGLENATLVYRLSFTYADLGARVVVADLDPQASLTLAFLDEDQLLSLWPDGQHPRTIAGCLRAPCNGIAETRHPHLEMITERLALLAGDLDLANLEDQLCEAWPKCLDGDEPSLQVISALGQAVQNAGHDYGADLVLLHFGPNLGAINRAAMTAANHVVLLLSPDLISLEALRNLGPKLRSWRSDWHKRIVRNPALDSAPPGGEMRPLGYIVQQPQIRLDRPVQRHGAWITQIPAVYSKAVCSGEGSDVTDPEQDVNCLGLLRSYRSLIPMAQEARKPMFHLKPADGALGSHFKAAQEARKDYAQLASKIAERANVILDFVEVWERSGRF